MTHYLIIGGGMTADAALRGIRECDVRGEITILSDEPVPPYNRPPLSKGLWKGEGRDSVWRHTPSEGVDLRLDTRARTIDRRAKTVTDEAGRTYPYDRLLLATGGSPRRLDVHDDGVIYFRTVADYDRLRRLADVSSRFAVIGGGFIGTEIAAALAAEGKQVTMLVRQPHLGAGVFPEDMTVFLDQYFREHGVELLTSEVVKAVEREDEAWSVVTGSGRRLLVAAVVAGLGITPNVSLAAAAGLRVDDGIIVDDYLRTLDPAIFAAGDVARFFSPALGRRLRCEHEDNANTMGTVAGRNMAGAVEPYHHLPYFYSDLFDAGYEAVGDLDAGLETVADWIEPFGKGVIYYLKDDRVRGVLLWNTWGQLAAARDMVRHAVVDDRNSLLGRIGAPE